VSANSTSTKPTVREVADSLTGYEERLIVQRFGAELEDLAGQAGSGMVRALIFICEKRKSDDPDVAAADRAAFKRAMSLTRKELDDQFSRPPQDDDEDGVESGKP
jgi:hypothetical protein